MRWWYTYWGIHLVFIPQQLYWYLYLEHQDYQLFPSHHYSLPRSLQLLLQRPRKGPSPLSPSWWWRSCYSCQRWSWWRCRRRLLRLNTGLRGGQYVQGILLSLVFLRLFKHEESPLSSTISLNMSESSLRFIKSSWLTSSLGESWWASKSELIKAMMCSNSSTATWWELILPYRSSCTSTWWPSTCSQASSKLF